MAQCVIDKKKPKQFHYFSETSDFKVLKGQKWVKTAFQQLSVSSDFRAVQKKHTEHVMMSF